MSKFGNPYSSKSLRKEKGVGKLENFLEEVESGEEVEDAPKDMEDGSDDLEEESEGRVFVVLSNDDVSHRGGGPTHLHGVFEDEGAASKAVGEIKENLEDNFEAGSNVYYKPTTLNNISSFQF